MVKRTEVGNHLIDPQRQRALATGIGQTQQRSCHSGQRRAQKIADCMPPGVAGKAIGYPPRDPMLEGMRAVYSYDQDAALPINGDVV